MEKRLGSFTYLGDVYDSDGDLSAAVVSKGEQAWAAFFFIKKVLCSPALSGTTKKVVYESCMRSVMLYAVETSNIKERLIQQNKQMLRIVTKKGYKEALLQLQLKPLSSIISISRLKW